MPLVRHVQVCTFTVTVSFEKYVESSTNLVRHGHFYGWYFVHNVSTLESLCARFQFIFAQHLAFQYNTDSWFCYYGTHDDIRVLEILQTNLM